jgi:RND family efflux transporter MFP subunit
MPIPRKSSVATSLIVAAFFYPLSVHGQGPPPALVETAPVQELEFHEQLTLVGRTEARAESRIVAEVSGRVSSVDAAEGRKVKRGTVLVTIDCRRIALDLEAKEAEAAQAAADAALAKKELLRAQDLVKTEVFPERNLDSAEATATATAERHKQLEAERRRLDLDLENCTIEAPYGGYTVRKLVDVGEWVDPGTPVYEMVDLEVMKVTVDLPERRFGQVELGAPVTVTFSGATLDGAPADGGELPGEITGIAPRASEATHTFPVMIAVKNSEGRLGSGMLVRATLNLAGTFRSLAVSKDAIVRDLEGTSVYTIADGKAKPVPVEVRATLGTMAAIEAEGLEVGEPVVVRGNERIFPGGPVRLQGGSGNGTAGNGAAAGEDGEEEGP